MDVKYAAFNTVIIFLFGADFPGIIKSVWELSENKIINSLGASFHTS